VFSQFSSNQNSDVSKTVDILTMVLAYLHHLSFASQMNSRSTSMHLVSLVLFPSYYDEPTLPWSFVGESTETKFHFHLRRGFGMGACLSAQA
jgi:hypothetical protein